VGVVLLVTTSLAAEKSAPAKPVVSQSPAKVRGIDPLSLPADQILITSITPQTASIGAVVGTSAGTGRSTVVFRVQILTSQGFGEARKAAQVAGEIFDQPVHVDYEIPNFKVRVGDFADRGAAEEYRRTAQQLGYSNCWVVPVTIGIVEASPLYDSLLAPIDSLRKADSVAKEAGGK
jgi:hypothetical protein